MNASEEDIKKLTESKRRIMHSEDHPCHPLSKFDWPRCKTICPLHKLRPCDFCSTNEMLERIDEILTKTYEILNQCIDEVLLGDNSDQQNKCT